LQNFPVRAGESQLAQLGQQTPATIWKCGELPTGDFSAKHLQRDSETCDGVPHLAQRFDGARTFAEETFGELQSVWAPAMQFGIWKFPEVSVDRARRALDALEAGARGRANLMPLLIDAVEASVTLGEICGRLREVFGVHQPSVTF